jgi:hypothetical protein
VFFGDLYAIDAATAEKLWSQDLGESAAARSPIAANGAQKVAVASGFTMLAWPTKIVQASRAPRPTTGDVESGARAELR